MFLLEYVLAVWECDGDGMLIDLLVDHMGSLNKEMASSSRVTYGTVWWGGVDEMILQVIEGQPCDY